MENRARCNRRGGSNRTEAEDVCGGADARGTRGDIALQRSFDPVEKLGPICRGEDTQFGEVRLIVGQASGLPSAATVDYLEPDELGE